MPHRAASLLVAAAALGATLAHAPTPARATVDAMLPYVVPVRHLQTDAICLVPQTMWAEIGIPPGSQMEALLAPALVYRQGGGHRDVNVLSLIGGMTATYVADAYEGDVVTYEMTLDVSALARRQGTSVAGRQATVDAAKLYLIAMAASLEQLAPSRWKLSIRFVGLPSQRGLRGRRLPASTSWPYTSSSALLARFRGELIDADRSCPP